MQIMNLRQQLYLIYFYGYILSIYLKLTDTYQNGILDQNGSLGPVLVFLCIDYIIDSEDGALCA
jgi:hypothetical protein